MIAAHEYATRDCKTACAGCEIAGITASAAVSVAARPSAGAHTAGGSLPTHFAIVAAARVEFSILPDRSRNTRNLLEISENYPFTNGNQPLVKDHWAGSVIFKSLFAGGEVILCKPPVGHLISRYSTALVSPRPK